MQQTKGKRHWWPCTQSLRMATFFPSTFSCSAASSHPSFPFSTCVAGLPLFFLPAHTPQDARKMFWKGGVGRARMHACVCVCVSVCVCVCVWTPELIPTTLATLLRLASCSCSCSCYCSCSCSGSCSFCFPSESPQKRAKTTSTAQVSGSFVSSSCPSLCGCLRLVPSLYPPCPHPLNVPHPTSHLPASRSPLLIGPRSVHATAQQTRIKANIHQEDDSCRFCFCFLFLFLRPCFFLPRCEPQLYAKEEVVLKEEDARQLLRRAIRGASQQLVNGEPASAPCMHVCLHACVSVCLWPRVFLDHSAHVRCASLLFSSLCTLRHLPLSQVEKLLDRRYEQTLKYRVRWMGDWPAEEKVCLCVCW